MNDETCKDCGGDFEPGKRIYAITGGHICAICQTLRFCAQEIAKARQTLEAMALIEGFGVVVKGRN